jgi:hypothetical protein
MGGSKMKIEKEKEIEQEYEIIKYALTYLISNLGDEVAEDMSEYVGTNDPTEIETILQKLIDEY